MWGKSVKDPINGVGERKGDQQAVKKLLVETSIDRLVNTKEKKTGEDGEKRDDLQISLRLSSSP